MRLARKSSSQPAALRLSRKEVLAWRLSDQVVGHVLDGGEVGRGVVGSDPALVIAEDHVHDPVQAVLDRPVAADDRTQQVRRQHQRGDVEACLPLDLSADLARAFDHDDGLQARPVVAFLQPGDIVDDGGGPGFDAAVIAIDRLVPADRGVLEACWPSARRRTARHPRAASPDCLSARGRSRPSCRRSSGRCRAGSPSHRWSRSRPRSPACPAAWGWR